MSLRRFLALLCCASVLALSPLLFTRNAVNAAPPGSGYHLIKKMPVGGDGGWDYLTVDSDARRIYIARGTHVMVVDEDKGTVVGDIPIADTKNVHGVALAKGLGKGYTSDGLANTVTVFDIATLKTLSTIKVTGENPDSILYDAANKRVWTFNGKTANATAIDATSGQVVGTVKLSGKPETPVLDGKGSIFLNIEDKNSLVEIDAKAMTVKHEYPMAGCEAPSGIAMDTAHRRVFSGCSDSKKLAVTDADSGKVVAAPEIGEDTDASGFDPGTGLAFASCREGVLSIIHADSPDKYTNVANVKTEFGARTMALDLKTHHVFVVTADFKPAPAATADNPHPRPQPVPGTFRILEYGE
jgi:DNA-binding beta-propeller fold protein YncE